MRGTISIEVSWRAAAVSVVYVVIGLPGLYNLTWPFHWQYVGTDLAVIGSVPTTFLCLFSGGSCLDYCWSVGYKGISSLYNICTLYIYIYVYSFMLFFSFLSDAYHIMLIHYVYCCCLDLQACVRLSTRLLMLGTTRTEGC